ncbi:MAG: response regulator transcription factor [Bacteroidota bacterium]
MEEVISIETKIKIAVALSDESYYNLINGLIDSRPRYQLVGNYKNVPDIIQNIETDQPDILIIDKYLRDKSTYGHLNKIISLREKMRILIVVQNEEYEDFLQGIGAGAFGFIQKTISPEKFFRTIDDVQENGVFMNNQIIQKIIKVLERASILNEGIPLSMREIQVKTLHFQGLNYKEIADKLYISPSTVRTHIRNIRTKFKKSLGNKCWK